jgi:hypothetical protein
MVLLFASNEAEGPNDLYGYRPDDNFFYLSGWSEPGAALLIVGAADPKDHSYTEILFLPNHNPSQEKWTGPKLGADSPDAGKITGFDHVEVLDNLRSELVRLLPAKKATVYTDVVADGEISIHRRLWIGSRGPTRSPSGFLSRMSVRCWLRSEPIRMREKSSASVTPPTPRLRPILQPCAR